MRFWKKLLFGPAVLVGVTVAIGAAFKVSAFARESFIAAKFGLSAVTDAYFGLQQFPTTLASFMFGAFGLAFTPAYAEARRRSATVTWLPGLLFYGCLLSAAMTALMLLCTPLLLHVFHSTEAKDVRNILAILSVCYVPIFFIGIWVGICTARGRNLWAMSVCGLPYPVMTLVLFGLYAIGRLSNLSLPISMTAGFALVGLYSLVCVLRSQPVLTRGTSWIALWRLPDFRQFLRQLIASSVEYGGFAGNQLAMMYFLSQAGTGIISANNCATRIGMLGYSLLAQPLSLLVQARLCSTEVNEQQSVFRRWILIIGGIVLVFAFTLLMFRIPVIRLAYMHGKFKGAELREVARLLPAWVGYFLVMSMNALVARYLFIRSQGGIYVRRQLCAYVAANLLRIGIGTSNGAAWIIWCSVATEAVALVLNLRTCVVNTSAPEMVPAMVAAGKEI